MTIPRMRTITETIAEIKAIDPMTVDLDDLFKYFSGLHD